MRVQTIKNQQQNFTAKKPSLLKALFESSTEMKLQKAQEKSDRLEMAYEATAKSKNNNTQLAKAYAKARDARIKVQELTAKLALKTGK